MHGLLKQAHLLIWASIPPQAETFQQHECLLYSLVFHLEALRRRNDELDDGEPDILPLKYQRQAMLVRRGDLLPHFTLLQL